MRPTKLEALRRRWYVEGRGSELGLWRLAADARDLLGPSVSEGELRSFTLQTLSPLLRVGGLATADFDAPGRPRLWPGEPDEHIRRIDAEWRALGRVPSLGEIAWFVGTTAHLPLDLMPPSTSVARLYEKPRSKLDLTELVESLGRHGLAQDPQLGASFVLLDQCDPGVPLTGFVDGQLSQGQPALFQLTFSHGPDPYCRIHLNAAHRVLDFRLESSDLDLAAMLGRALQQHVLGQASTADQVVGLVFDPLGRVDGYDFDAFYAGRVPLKCEERSALPATVLSRLPIPAPVEGVTVDHLDANFVQLRQAAEPPGLPRAVIRRA